MFIITVEYTQPIEKIDAHLAEHRDFLRERYAAGQLIMSGPKVPREGGILIANASNKTDVEKMIAEDPFYKKGLAKYEIIEFDPVLHSVDNMRLAFSSK